MKLVILNKNQTVLTYSDVQISTQLVGDCIEILKSRDLMEGIKDSLNIDDISANDLASNIEIDSPVGTRVLVIKVTDTNAIRAKRIADAIYELGGEYIKNSLDVYSVNIIEQPVVATSPSSPNVQRNTILGGIAGAILMIALAVIKRLTNNKLTTVEEIESELGVTVLASIPKSGIQAKKRIHRSVIAPNEEAQNQSGGIRNE